MGLLDAFLDASVLWSFDRSGFRRHARAFGATDLDVDLSARAFAVTGANSGIGRATARALARRGAAVHLLCRSAERGAEAEASLRRETGNERVRLDVLDVSDLDAVRAWAARAPGRLYGLVHNAGLLPHDRRESRQGLEVTLATHVVGPWLLTSLLRPALDAAGGRVVFVSSGGMYTRPLSLEDVDWRARPYDGLIAYAQTKRMQVVLAGLMAERWGAGGTRFHAMHPGWADTPAVREALPRFWRFMRGRLRTPEEGADTVVWLCVAPEGATTTGGFWFDRAARSAHLLPGTRERRADRDALWSLCERLAGGNA